MKKLFILYAILIGQSAFAIDVNSNDGRESSAAAYSKCVSVATGEYNAPTDIAEKMCKCVVNRVLAGLSQSEINNQNEPQVQAKISKLTENAFNQCAKRFNIK